MSKNDVLLIPTETLQTIMETLKEHDDKFDSIEYELFEVKASIKDLTAVVMKLREAILEKL